MISPAPLGGPGICPLCGQIPEPKGVKGIQSPCGEAWRGAAPPKEQLRVLSLVFSCEIRSRGSCDADFRSRSVYLPFRTRMRHRTIFTGGWPGMVCVGVVWCPREWKEWADLAGNGAAVNGSVTAVSSAGGAEGGGLIALLFSYSGEAFRAGPFACFSDRSRGRFIILWAENVPESGAANRSYHEPPEKLPHRATKVLSSPSA